MAGMLPPFVPPSARVSTETLPLITAFVMDRTEQSFDNSFDMSGGSEAVAVAALPSIDEFLRDVPNVDAHAETPDDEFVQRTSRSPWGTYEAQHEVSGVSATAQPSIPAAALLQPDLMPVERRTPPSGAEGAILNETTEPAEAWEASAASVRKSEPLPDSSTTGSKSPTEREASVTQPSPEVWVEEERDAFDWHGVANLTVAPAEAQRAADEWSATEWERSSGSVQDHVASLVAQVARRVRSGELEIQGSKQMGTEAALVAILSALLSEPGRE